MKLYSKIALFVVASIAVSCSDDDTHINNTEHVVPQYEQGPVESDTTETVLPVPVEPNTVEPKIEPERTKTEAEVWEEAGEFAAEKVIDLVEKRRKRDSLRAVSRKPKFAYQIGLLMKEEGLFEVFQQLRAGGLTNLYAYKESRKRYYLIKYDGLSESIVKSQEDSIAKIVRSITGKVTEVVNLMRDPYCGKGVLVDGESLRMRKKDFAVRVLECD